MGKNNVVVKSKKTKVVAPVKPALPKPMNKTELLAHLAEATGNDVKPIKAVMQALEDLIFSSLAPGGRGVFMLPGVVKLTTKKVPAKKMPAIKAGTEVRNPRTGEMMLAKARAAYTKPKTVKITARVLTKVKNAAKG